MLARVPVKRDSSPGSVGWAALAVRAGGRRCWLGPGPSTTPGRSEVVCSRDGVAIPVGASVLLPLAWPAVQHLAFSCKPSTERVRCQPHVCFSLGKWGRFYFFSYATTAWCHLSPAAEEKPSPASLSGEAWPLLILPLALLKLNSRLFW